MQRRSMIATPFTVSAAGIVPKACYGRNDVVMPRAVFTENDGPEVIKPSVDVAVKHGLFARAVTLDDIVTPAVARRPRKRARHDSSRER